MSEVYGKSDAVPFLEDGDRVIGPTVKSRWSYAESRAIDEFLALAYHKQFGVPVTVCRVPDTSKVRTLIGWQPAVPMDQTLGEVNVEFRAGQCRYRKATRL